MGIKCPKCSSDNPSDSKYCKECATPLPLSGEVSVTKTLETPVEGLKSGTTFAERYEIIEELGTGGMGKVYRVKDEKLDEEMALKVLRPDIAANKSMIERFKNELKLARKIAHRSVCRMYDLNEEEGTHFITMEYVHGEDLKSYIRKQGTMSEEEAINIAKQVCEGLAEAHELGVVHRDLKPQNIMIDEKGRAKIMDFGIARSVEAPGMTQTGVMIGTPDYISPEQAEGEEADQRSDIYSLGVILYEMVTGSVPFKGDTALSVALKHKAQLPKDPKKLNPEVSDNLSRLILICMEKDRRRRYQTAEELINDLRNIEEGLPFGTKIRPRRETYVAALIRKKLLIPALVVTLAIIAVAIWQLLPQKEAIPSIPSGKPSLAVVYFENNTGDESLDYLRKAFSDLLISDLSQSKYLDVLPGDRLFKILEDLNQLETKSYSSDILKEVASQGGVENILRGSYSKAGDTLRINIMLQKASTGETIGSERAEGKGEESFFSMVDELTPKIKANFDLSAEEIASDIDKDIGKITTSYPEAYKYFSDGYEHNLKGDFNLSIPFMERAIAIDPEFASAYRWLAWAYRNTGFASEYNKYIQKAFELSDRLPDRERYQIQGDFYFRSEETYDNAVEAYNKLLELYPNDWLGNQILGVIYRNMEEWDKAIERFEVNIKNRIENFYSYNAQSRAYSNKGFYDKAIKVCENYIIAFSDHFEIRFSLAMNYLCKAEYDNALGEADKAFSLDPVNHWNPYLKGYIYLCKGDLIKAEEEFKKLLNMKQEIAKLFARSRFGFLYLLQGKFEKSIHQNMLGITLAEKADDKIWISEFCVNLSYLYLITGNPRDALKESDKALNNAVMAKNLDYQRLALYYKGLAYLKMESMDEAQRTADELKELIERGVKKKSKRYYLHLMGMIELERENFSKAIGYFKEAISLLHSQAWQFSGDRHALFIDPLALAYYKAVDLENAREEYEKITTLITGRLSYGDIFAKSFYMLGKIYEQQGDAIKAIKHYEKFLDLWKNADLGIPELEDVKKSLAGLKKD